jgi:hypothetical protein
VLAFIYADLIVLPILNIYRKYYGLSISLFLFFTMYASMTAAALVIELIFRAIGWVPAERHARIVETAIQWNYMTILNIIFLVLTVMLVIRFMRSGGPNMLKMMNKPMHEDQIHITEVRPQGNVW